MMADYIPAAIRLTASHPARGQGLFLSFFFSRCRVSSCVQSRPLHALFNDSWGDGGERSDSRSEETETHLNDDDGGDATQTEKVDGVSSSFAIKYERLSSR